MNEDDPIQKEIQERNRLQARPSRARYDKVHAALLLKWRRRELRPDRMMREIVDELWDQFGGNPYSWCGFYLPAPSGTELALGPHRDKPATSPLPLHGVCGKVFQSGQAMVVPDVAALGDAHIACDPANRSEICVPVLDQAGKVWAVFDVDSAQPSAFDDMDLRWIERILKNFQDIPK